MAGPTNNDTFNGYLEDISTAKKGRDVRDAIHDGLLDVYNETSFEAFAGVSEMVGYGENPSADSHKTRIEALETASADHEGRLDTLEDTADDLSERVGTLEEKVDLKELDFQIAVNRGGIAISSGGVGTNTSYFVHTGFVNVEGLSKVAYKRPCLTASTINYGAAFYTNNTGTFIEGSGDPLGINAETPHSDIRVISVPTGAKYARFTWWYGGDGNAWGADYPASVLNEEFAVYDGENYETALIPRVDILEENQAGLLAGTKEVVTPMWKLGVTVDEHGEESPTIPSSALSDYVDADTFYRGGVLTDGTNNLNMFVVQYAGDTYISRIYFNTLDTAVNLDSRCTRVRFIFGRPQSTEIAVTWEDIAQYCSIYHYVDVAKMLEEKKEYLSTDGWSLGTTITASGAISSTANTKHLATSGFYPASALVRTGKRKDSANYDLNLLICQYNGNTFISRSSFNYMGTAFTLDASCTQVRFVFGRPSTSNPPDITQADIDEYFRVYRIVTLKDVRTQVEALKNRQGNIDLSGKRVSILGDSISTFVPEGEKAVVGGHDTAPAGCATTYPGNLVQYSNWDVTNIDTMWWKQVFDYFGMVLGINESFASSMIAWNGTSETYRYGEDKCMASDYRINHLDENGTPDFIFIYGGTNDINHSDVNEENIPIGELFTTIEPMDYEYFAENFYEVEVQDEEDPTKTKIIYSTQTFTGAVQTMVTKIQHKFPNAKIIALLPYYVTKNHYNFVQHTGNKTKDVKSHNDAMITVFDYMGVDYVDLRKVINVFDIDTLTADGLHPNAAGMALIAKAVIRKIESIM